MSTRENYRPHRPHRPTGRDGVGVVHIIERVLAVLLESGDIAQVRMACAPAKD